MQTDTSNSSIAWFWWERVKNSIGVFDVFDEGLSWQMSIMLKRLSAERFLSLLERYMYVYVSYRISPTKVGMGLDGLIYW